MRHQRRSSLSPVRAALLAAVGFSGCAHPTLCLRWPPASRSGVVPASVEITTSASSPAAATPGSPADWSAPQPVDAFIRRALDENRTVRAARCNVLAVRSRIDQATALDDPILSNTIFPIPAVAPQFALMGYMPYDALLAQQFPWFGTLKLRGQAASEDVKVALFELAAAELDAVAAVKRAYHDLAYNQRARAILEENRRLADDFLTIARERYRTGNASQTDVLRSEIAVTDLDRELETIAEGLAEARAELARQVHLDPETTLIAQPLAPFDEAPVAVDRLYRLASASRPELHGRLAAIARDATAVELARKRYYPNVTLGLVYQDMQRTNAVQPQTASGVPNVGLFVGLNLPVYRKKLAAGVREARARASADAQLYEAERDQVFREVKDLMTQVKVERNVVALLRDGNLPRTRQILESVASDYRAANVDYFSLVSAWRDVLQVELQIAAVEAELGKALASLERAVGSHLNAHPPVPDSSSPPPPPTFPAPFRPDRANVAPTR